MTISYILFFIGFGLLIKGANLLVDGASSLARRLGVSTLVIGLTVVSFGTSAPELAVNLIASINGSSDIAIGNILGSNIANILLILGVSAVIFPLTVKESTVWKEIPFSFLAIAVLAFMVNDVLIDHDTFSVLSRIDGLVLISFFIIFLYYVFSISKVEPITTDVSIHDYSLFKSYTMIGVGLVGLVVGGKWIVDGAVVIATSLGMSEALIGLTVVAIGTSLPELATSVVAAWKKDFDIAVGNVVGSNIFNIFWILGLSAIVRPLPFSSMLNFDVAMVLFATFLLFVFLFTGKRHIIGRLEGLRFVILYICYIVYLFMRG